MSWGDDLDLTDLVPCPECPRPGLVPSKEMTEHIALLHQGEAFRCAVCKFSGVTLDFLRYEAIKTHLVEAHNVTEKSRLPSSILLPSNLLRWSCRICQDFKMKSQEQLVIQHIEQVHGGFYLASSGGWSSAVCRICQVELTGDHIWGLHFEQHLREGFAMEKEDEDPPGSDRGRSAREDQDSATGARAKEQKKQRLPSHSVTREKINKKKDKEEREYSPSRGRRKMKQKSRVSSSSSSSSRTSSTYRSSRSRKARRSKSPPRRSMSRPHRSKSRPRRSKSRPRRSKSRPRRSKSPPRRSMSRPHRSKSRSRRSKSRPRRSKSRPRRSKSRPRRSMSRPHRSKSRPRRSKSRPRRSKSPPRRSKSRSRRSKSRPRRSKTPLRRSKSPRRRSKSRPGRSSPEGRRPTRYLPEGRGQRGPRARSRSPSRSPCYPTRARVPGEREPYHPRRGRIGRSRSGSPRRVSPRSIRSKSPKSSGVLSGRQARFSPSPSHSSGQRSQSSGSGAGDFIIVGVGCEVKYKCQVCNTLSSSRVEHDQHKEGRKHNNAKKNTYCKHCRVHTSVQHFHCQVCDVHSSGPQPWQDHLRSSRHKEKQKEGSDVAPTSNNNASPRVSPPSAAALQCPACQQDFEELAQLKDHVKNNHDILLTCTECEARGYNPKGEALFCQELIEHYSQGHNKKITVQDLPCYGKKGGEKMRPQGYVMCQLCPRPSYQTLGRPGLWFTNQLSLHTIRSHFSKFHPGKENYQDLIILGCQLCEDQLPGSRGEAQWRALLNKHNQDDAEEEGEISDLPTPGSVLRLLCPYCGETVPREGEASQHHIKQRHLELTFACKLCRLTDRFYYQSLEDVNKHLKLKHLGVNNYKISNIVLPGSPSNLLAFAWVNCKVCHFKGIGGGKEVWDHLLLHSGSGERILEIFCRLCHREDTLNVKHFQDFQEFLEHFKAGHSDIIRCL